MNEIDVFKLGFALGFDIRGAELSEEINSIIIVNEKEKFIEGFESNKVILIIVEKISVLKEIVLQHI